MIRRLLASTVLVALACGTGSGPDLAFQRAINAADEGRYDRARLHLAAHLEAHPDRVDAWRLAGDAWMSGRLRSPSRAVEHWTRYLELRPGDREVAIKRASALLLLGAWDEAETAGRDLGDSPEAQQLRARVFCESDPPRAQRAIEAALASEESARLHAAAWKVYLQLDDPEKAGVHAARAIELDPLDLQSTYVLARLSRRRGDDQKAGELLARHRALARLEGAGSLPAPSSTEALRLLQELDPGVNVRAIPYRLQKLRLLVAAGRHVEARELLETLAVDPGLGAATRLELAGLADRLADLDLARQLLAGILSEEIAAADPDPGAARAREALYGLALLDYRSGDRSGARKRLGAALRRFPYAARLHHLHGRLELEDGRPAAAAASFRRALELAPFRTECRLELASLWLSQGRRRAVAALLASAPEASPELEAYRVRHAL